MKTPNKKMPDKNAQADTALDKARELADNGQLNAAITTIAAVEKRHRKNPGYRANWPVTICKQGTPNLPRATATGRWQWLATNRRSTSLKSGSRPSCASVGPRRLKSWLCAGCKSTVTAPHFITY